MKFCIFFYHGWRGFALIPQSILPIGLLLTLHVRPIIVKCWWPSNPFSPSFEVWLYKPTGVVLLCFSQHKSLVLSSPLVYPSGLQNYSTLSCCIYFQMERVKETFVDKLEEFRRSHIVTAKVNNQAGRMTTVVDLLGAFYECYPTCRGDNFNEPTVRVWKFWSWHLFHPLCPLWPTRNHANVVLKL